MGKIRTGLYIAGGLAAANAVPSVAIGLLIRKSNEFYETAATIAVPFGLLTAACALLVPPMYAFSCLQHNGILTPWDFKAASEHSPTTPQTTTAAALPQLAPHPTKKP